MKKLFLILIYLVFLMSSSYSETDINLKHNGKFIHFNLEETKWG